MERILTGIVENHPGVLADIAQKFKELKINIASMNVAETDDERFSYLTMVIQASDVDIEKIKEALSHSVEIQKLAHLGQGDHHERELVLVQIAFTAGHLSPITQIAELFRAQVIGVGPGSLTLQFVGEAEQVKGFIAMLKPFGIIGMARTGRTALKKD